MTQITQLLLFPFSFPIAFLHYSLNWGNVPITLNGWTGKNHTAGFLNLSNMGIWGQIIICSGSHSVHCEMFCSIPDLYSLDASNTPPPIHDNPKCLQTLSDALWGVRVAQSCPWLRTTDKDHSEKQTSKC